LKTNHWEQGLGVLGAVRDLDRIRAGGAVGDPEGLRLLGI